MTNRPGTDLEQTGPAGPARPLLGDLRELIVAPRISVARAVDSGLVTLYWHIGRRIREDILGQQRAEYGQEIVSALGRQLGHEFGRGFSEKALRHMVRFAEAFADESIVSALRRQLTWTHFKTLIYLEDPLKRDFYAEKDLESALLREIESFLLELGGGFAFVARQKRITLDGVDYYMDLLFYHRHLRRLVVIELKLGDFRPADLGQIELYLRWLDRHERAAGEEPPIGLILCAGKKDETVEYLGLDRAGVRVAEYLT